MTETGRFDNGHGVIIVRAKKTAKKDVAHKDDDKTGEEADDGRQGSVIQTPAPRSRR